jgi:signal transduction histidine kinase
MRRLTSLKKTLLLAILLLCGFSFQGFNSSQDILSRVKVALIYNFAHNIDWANEEALNEYVIGIVSSDTALYNEFFILSENQKIKKKPIRITKIIDIFQLKDCQIIYFDQAYCGILSDIYGQIAGKNTLIISDKCSDRLFTMINLLYDNQTQTLSYEINRQNILLEGFKLSPDILLHGGSYIDLKDLYLRTYEQLKEESQKIKGIQEEMEKILMEKDSIQEQTDILLNQISFLEGYRDNLEKDFQGLADSLKAKDIILQKSSREVNRFASESRTLQDRISNQLSLLADVTDSLSAMNFEIKKKQVELDDKQRRIDDQRLALSEKETVISIQKKLIVLSIALAISFLLALYTTYRAYRTRKELNQKLEILVDERTRELNISKEHFRNLFESSPIAICDMDAGEVIDFVKSLGSTLDEVERRIEADPDLIKKAVDLIKVTDANTATLKLFDYNNKDEFIRNYSQTYQKDYPRSFKQTLLALFLNVKLFSYDGYRQTSKGELKYLQISWIVLPGFEKDYNRVIVSMADITELTRHRNHLEELVSERSEEILNLNRELIETVEELENTLQMLKETQNQLINSEKMASLGMLTAGIAHEINNPINYISASKQAIDSLVENLVAEVKRQKEILVSLSNNDVYEGIDIEETTSSVRFLLQNIDVGIKRTTEIIGGLMTYSRTGEFSLTQFNLAEAIKNSLIILHSKYYGRINIIENYEEVPLVNCNASSINQVIMNLIANAIDAIEGEGTIEISLKQDKDTNEVQCSIKDSGEGIPDDLKIKIFDPFFTTKEVGKGVGLGLYITYRIIQQHNGSIAVISEEGRGSEFIIKFPIKQ